MVEEVRGVLGGSGVGAALASALVSSARRADVGAEAARDAVGVVTAAGTVEWSSRAAETFRERLTRDASAGRGVEEACVDASRALRGLAATLGGSR